jgi:hypothetical protein
MDILGCDAVHIGTLLYNHKIVHPHKEVTVIFTANKNLKFKVSKL